jgi:hypothetical protein
MSRADPTIMLFSLPPLGANTFRCPVCKRVRTKATRNQRYCVGDCQREAGRRKEQQRLSQRKRGGH